MPRTVHFVVDAEHDLEELYVFLLENDSPEAADAILSRIVAACDSLSELPHRGHCPPELELLGILAFRELRAGVHRLIYEIRDDDVVVHAVLDARRDLRDILAERLAR